MAFVFGKRNEVTCLFKVEAGEISLKKYLEQYLSRITVALFLFLYSLQNDIDVHFSSQRALYLIYPITVGVLQMV